MEASTGISRTAETKRAASSECPPRSVKKSASNGSAWLPKTRLAATSSAASVSLRGSSCSPGASPAASVTARRALRSTLPEVRRGSDSEDLEVARDHVGRQLLAQVRAQGRAVERGPALQHQERDEAVHALVLAQHHGRLGDARQMRNLRLDLAEFDAEAADLDLVVDAAVEGDVAVLVEAHGVARAIEDRIAAVGRERVFDELLGGQLRAFEVARRDARTADQKLSLHPRRQQVQGLATT